MCGDFLYGATPYWTFLRGETRFSVLIGTFVQFGSVISNTVLFFVLS